MRTQSNYMGKAKLQKKVLTTIMTGFLFAGISNTALADNVSVPDSKNDGQTIGAGNTAAGDGWSVEVGSDNNKSVYSVGDKNAISLRDNATIHIKKTPLSPTQPTGTLAILAPAPILSKSVPVLRSLLTAQCKSMVRRIWAKRSTCMAAAIRSLSTVQLLLKKARLSGFRTGQAPAMTAGTASSIMA